MTQGKSNVTNEIMSVLLVPFCAVYRGKSEQIIISALKTLKINAFRCIRIASIPGSQSSCNLCRSVQNKAKNAQSVPLYLGLL